MYQLRKSSDRGQFQHGWLDTAHSFSFGHYRDPAHMGFRALRVINEDHIAPGAGFPEHPHANMEILTYVLSGDLQHRDSLGNGSVIRPGEVQRMRAGSGIRHSEFNASSEDPVHLLQIWILPDRDNAEPGYAQKDFTEDRKNRLCLVASADGRDGSLDIHQDTDVFAVALEEGRTLHHGFKKNRHGWLQVAKGFLVVNGHSLKAGDGLAISDLDALEISAESDAEFLLFDLA